jgi:hypothetical protein
VATLATVKLSVSTELLDGFLFLPAGIEAVRIVVVPTFEVAEAELSFRIFLITSSLAGFLLFDFESHVNPPGLIHFSIESLQSRQSTVNSSQFWVATHFHGVAASLARQMAM